MDRAAQPRDAIVAHVVTVLRRVAAPYDGSVTERTELYYDLGLAGDDLHDAIEAVREPYSTDFSQMDLRRHAPNEVGHNFGLNLIREFREWCGARTYRSLTVASLIAAVQGGAWKDC